MDGAFFDDPKNSVGKLTTRLSSDTQSVAGAIDQRLADVLQASKNQPTPQIIIL